MKAGIYLGKKPIKIQELTLSEVPADDDHHPAEHDLFSIALSFVATIGALNLVVGAPVHNAGSVPVMPTRYFY